MERIKQRITFDSQGCEIRKKGSGRLVENAYRTSNNVYILNEIKEEKWYVGNIDESWLWNRRMGHINFDSLVKNNTKQAMIDMPKITKPSNTLYKQCQHGKLRREGFKSNGNSTMNSLEHVHIDICWPTRT